MYLTRSPKQRYMDYLHADTGYSFAEYLGIDEPLIEFWNGKCRYRSRKASGTWETLKKDARASYKQALKAVKR